MLINSKLTYCLTDRLTNRLTDRLTDCFTDWLPNLRRTDHNPLSAFNNRIRGLAQIRGIQCINRLIISTGLCLAFSLDAKKFQLSVKREGERWTEKAIIEGDQRRWTVCATSKGASFGFKADQRRAYWLKWEKISHWAKCGAAKSLTKNLRISLLF